MKRYYTFTEGQPDGDLISKTARNDLYRNGFIIRYQGWNIISEKGAQYVIDMELRRA